MVIQTRNVYVFNYILPMADVILLNSLYLMAWHLTGGLDVTLSAMGRSYIVVCNLTWMFASAATRLYDVSDRRKAAKLSILTIKSLLLHLLIFGPYLYFSEMNAAKVDFLSAFYVSTAVLFFGSRRLGQKLYNQVVRKDKAAKKVAILGSNDTALRFSSFLEVQRNLDFYGFLGNDESMSLENSGSISLEVAERFQEAAKAGVTDVYVALPVNRFSDTHALLGEADRHCLRLKFIPDLSSSISDQYNMSYIGGQFPVITLRHEPLEDIQNRFQKRLFDVIFSTVVICTVLIWLIPILALAIKIDSRGPVFFRQRRSGRNDQPFWCYKLRTMSVDNSKHALQAQKNDARVTKVGRFLRRTSLDELPQFFNVLLGEMSVIGPRPHMLEHTFHYREVINQFMVRHFLKPGITGWAQVNGHRGETKLHKEMEDRVKHDIFYLEHWTVLLDIKIVYMTIANIINGEEKAY